MVLGQSLNRDGSPPSTLVLRAEHAAQLQAKLRCAVIPTGGDPARTGKSEAEVMKSQLVGLGVDPTVIHLEDCAMNTCHNAALVVPILRSLGCQRVFLVTSDFHMPRATYLFEAVFKHFGSASTIFVPSPASSGCPAAHIPDLGVNGCTLRKRLEDERRYCSPAMLQKFLSKHIPDVAVPMLSEARGLQAIAQVDTMLAQSKDAAPSCQQQSPAAQKRGGGSAGQKCLCQ